MDQLKKLKTFEDACKVEGLNPKKVLPNIPPMFPDKHRKALVAIAKLIIIVAAANRLVNEGKQWKPNWKDHSEYKYFAWFEMRGSSGFRFHVYVRWYSHSGVGSRLAFKNSDTATYIGKKFEKLFKDFMVL
jgi:hypothetical protein